MCFGLAGGVPPPLLVLLCVRMAGILELAARAPLLPGEAAADAATAPIRCTDHVDAVAFGAEQPT